jgi:hypothetical protein
VISLILASTSTPLSYSKKSKPAKGIVKSKVLHVQSMGEELQRTKAIHHGRSVESRAYLFERGGEREREGE